MEQEEKESGWENNEESTQTNIYTDVTVKSFNWHGSIHVQ